MSVVPEAGIEPVDAHGNGRPVEGHAGRGHRMLYLAGRPSLRSFVRYVRHHAATPPPDREIAAWWTQSNEVVRQLEVDEAGRADNPQMLALGPEYEPLLEELFTDPVIRNSYNSVPTDIVLVELDRLVVYQKHIDVGFANARADKLRGPEKMPDKASVFRTCLPFDHPQPPVRWSRVKGNTFAFVTPSNDLRSLGAVKLGAANVTGMALSGSLVGIAGIAVGFGSNFLNAIHAEGRLLLNNGSHRAYALRSMGVTHVPCIVQHVKSREELRLVSDSTHTDEADRYFTAARPPMLCDYFDPRLFVMLDSVPRMTQIRVTIEVDEGWLPAI